MHTTKRKQTFEDLISHLKHHNPNTRRGPVFTKPSQRSLGTYPSHVRCDPWPQGTSQYLPNADTTTVDPPCYDDRPIDERRGPCFPWASRSMHTVTPKPKPGPECSTSTTLVLPMVYATRTQCEIFHVPPTPDMDKRTVFRMISSLTRVQSSSSQLPPKPISSRRSGWTRFVSLTCFWSEFPRSL